jgi:hypothetical protein
MKIIWADSSPSWGIPDREEMKEELAKDQEPSPLEAPEDDTKEKDLPSFKGFG